MKSSLIVLIVTCLLLLGLSLWVSIQPPLFDIDLLQIIDASRTTSVDNFFNVITWAGSAQVLIPVGLVWSYSIYRRGRRSDAAFFIGSYVLATLLARVIKVIIARPRPGVDLAQLQQVTSYAFPSSHVTQFTAFVLLCYLTFRTLKPSWQLPAALIIAGMILVVALSRLYLQVHYPTDVIGGVLAGIIAVTTGQLVMAKTSRGKTGPDNAD